MLKTKAVIINSVIYYLASLAGRALSFLLLPVFTYYLTQEDYGILGIISSVTAIISIYIGLNPQLFLMVKGPLQEKEDISVYIFNMLQLTVISFFIVAFILFISHDIFFSAKLPTGRWILLMIAVYCLCNTIIRILDTTFQIEKNAFKSSTIQLAQSFFSLGIASILIIIFSFRWEGLYFSDFIVTFLIAGYSTFLLYRKSYIKIKSETGKMKELLYYLFPLTFHNLGFVVIGNADKLLISNILDIKAVGIYNVAMTIGMIIAIMHDSVLKAWNPFFFENLHRNNISVNIRIVKFLYLYCAFSLVMFFLFSLTIPYIFKIMVHEKFNEALSLIPVIALGYTILGMRNTLAGYLYQAGKTRIIAYISIFSAVTNIGLNYLLINSNGLSGAAEAALYSYIILFVMTLYFANKFNKIPWLLK